MTDLAELWERASAVKSLRRVSLPRLDTWNYDPCEHHETATPQCEFRKCGSAPFDHQTVSATFHLLARRTIDASQTGTGKTNSLLLTLCLAKHLGEELRALIIVPTTSVHQWAAEIQRFAPGLRATVVTAASPKAERLARYASDWEVLILGFHLATRDVEALEVLRPRQLISDDVDALLNLSNATHKAVVRLSRAADRVIVANATPIHTRLQQAYAATQPIAGKSIWGSIKSFEARYVKKEPFFIWTTNTAGEKQRRKATKVTGYQNIEDFKSRYLPMVIRHRYSDLADLRIPEVTTENVWLELHPAQRGRYELLQNGVLELRKRDLPPEQRQVAAVAAWTHGCQVCAGLPALGEEDGPGASVKLDWILDRLTGDWDSEKVVVYSRFQGTLVALQRRLDAVGVGHAAIWGGLTGSDARSEEIRRFWEDPDCRVMIISAAGERSLNLQNARVLVSVDLNLNPSRAIQILGRIRRAGSTHDRLLAINLLTTATQEENYMTRLGIRQALVDNVNGEDTSDLFEKLPSDVLLQLISP